MKKSRWSSGAFNSIIIDPFVCRRSFSTISKHFVAWTSPPNGVRSCRFRALVAFEFTGRNASITRAPAKRPTRRSVFRARLIKNTGDRTSRSFRENSRKKFVVRSRSFRAGAFVESREPSVVSEVVRTARKFCLGGRLFFFF